MPGLEEFTPIFQEDLATIRSRIEGDLNAGLVPTDEGWVDTTEGGIVYMLTLAYALEAERIWDAVATEMVAASFPAYAWGEYLDLHAEVVGLARKDATKARGQVTFSGADGTLIGTGTQVAVEATDPDADEVLFETTEPGTITGGSVILDAEAALAGPQGNVAGGQVSLLWSPVDGVTSVTNAVAMKGGAELEQDSALSDRVRAEYQAAGGGGSIDDYKRWVLEDPDVGYVTVVPTWLGPGTVRVIITDPNNDPVDQSVVDRVQQQLDPFAAATTLSAPSTLPDVTIDLVDASAFESPAGKAIIGGAQLVTYTGKTGNQLTGGAGGSGTHAAGTSVTQSGRGDGQAPIGAIVTVTTPVAVQVAIAADVILKGGYTFSGMDGQIDVSAEVEANLRDYVDNLPPGEDVKVARIIGQLVAVDGVDDVVSVQVGPETALTAVENLPQAIIDVGSTRGFANAGTALVGTQSVTYTGKTATTLTGGAGGTGSQPIGTPVRQLSGANMVIADTPNAEVATLGTVILT